MSIEDKKCRKCGKPADCAFMGVRVCELHFPGMLPGEKAKEWLREINEPIESSKEWDLREVDEAIMDFQIHVREVTGGNSFACVDSTELKRSIKKLLQEQRIRDREELFTTIIKHFESIPKGAKCPRLTARESVIFELNKLKKS